MHSLVVVMIQTLHACKQTTHNFTYLDNLLLFTVWFSEYFWVTCVRGILFYLVQNSEIIVTGSTWKAQFRPGRLLPLPWTWRVWFCLSVSIIVWKYSVSDWPYLDVISQYDCTASLVPVRKPAFRELWNIRKMVMKFLICIVLFVHSAISAQLY